MGATASRSVKLQLYGPTTSTGLPVKHIALEATDDSGSLVQIGDGGSVFQPEDVYLQYRGRLLCRVEAAGSALKASSMRIYYESQSDDANLLDLKSAGVTKLESSRGEVRVRFVGVPGRVRFVV